MKPTAKLNQVAPQTTIMMTKTGAASRRAIVTALAGVASAVGPKVVCRRASVSLTGPALTA